VHGHGGAKDPPELHRDAHFSRQAEGTPFFGLRGDAKERFRNYVNWLDDDIRGFSPMKTVILVLAFSLAAPAMAQDVPEIRRAVPPNVESSSAMWHIKGGNGRCASRGTLHWKSRLRPCTAPSVLIPPDVGIPKGSGCSNSVYGTVILYTPAPGFVGQDRFAINRVRDAMAFDWIGPPPGPRKYIMTVGASR